MRKEPAFPQKSESVSGRKKEILLALHGFICYSYPINKKIREDKLWIG